MKLFNCPNFVWAICTSIFLVQMAFICNDYHLGKTGVGRTLDNSEPEVQLPCLTFCPLPAFKQEGFSDVKLKTNLDEFMNFTHGLNEVFSNTSKQK